MFSGICLSEPLVTHEASGVPVGSKNEFDLKHYIDDLKCFETIYFFPNRGGRDGVGPYLEHSKYFYFFIFDPLPYTFLIFRDTFIFCAKNCELKSCQDNNFDRNC